MTGKTKITAAIETALETGKAYVNVHTGKNPGGEIRGQIKNS
jgi:CHRD domain